MKETMMIFDPDGRLISSTRNVYVFSDEKSWIDRLFELFTWGGLLVICIAIASMFV